MTFLGAKHRVDSKKSHPLGDGYVDEASRKKKKKRPIHRNDRAVVFYNWRSLKKVVGVCEKGKKVRRRGGRGELLSVLIEKKVSTANASLR